MLEIINTIVSWIATFFRAGGMLAKDSERVKMLVSLGNLGWLISGALTANVPLVVSNAVCLLLMGVEIIRNKKGKK